MVVQAAGKLGLVQMRCYMLVWHLLKSSLKKIGLLQRNKDDKYMRLRRSTQSKSKLVGGFQRTSSSLHARPLPFKGVFLFFVTPLS